MSRQVNPDSLHQRVLAAVAVGRWLVTWHMDRERIRRRLEGL